MLFVMIKDITINGLVLLDIIVERGIDELCFDTVLI